MWFLETWRWLGTCAFVQTVENPIGQLCLQLSMRKTTNCYKLNCCLSGFLIPKVGFRKKHLTQRPWSKVFNIKASREYYNLTYRFSLFVLPSLIKHAVLHLFTTFSLELNFVVFFSYCFYVSISIQWKWSKMSYICFSSLSTKTISSNIKFESMA